MTAPQPVPRASVLTAVCSTREATGWPAGVSGLGWARLDAATPHGHDGTRPPLMQTRRTGQPRLLPYTTARLVGVSLSRLATLSPALTLPVPFFLPGQTVSSAPSLSVNTERQSHGQGKSICKTGRRSSSKMTNRSFSCTVPRTGRHRECLLAFFFFCVRARDPAGCGCGCVRARAPGCQTRTHARIDARARAPHRRPTATTPRHDHPPGKGLARPNTRTPGLPAPRVAPPQVWHALQLGHQIHLWRPGSNHKAALQKTGQEEDVPPV